MEGDDYWCSPTRLQKHINFLEEHRECVLSVNKITIYDKDEQFRTLNLEMQNDETYQLITLEDLLIWNHIVNFSSVVYRGETLKKINPKIWDVSVKNVDDWLIALELAQYGLVGKLSQHMTIYRRHTTNTYGNIQESDFYKDVIYRIDTYDEYFQYKYHHLFAKHKEGNLQALKQLKDNKLKNSLPKIVWLMYRECIKLSSYFKRFIMMFFSADFKRKIKNLMKQ